MSAAAIAGALVAGLDKLDWAVAVAALMDTGDTGYSYWLGFSGAGGGGGGKAFSTRLMRFERP